MQWHKHKTSSAYSSTNYSLFWTYSPTANTFGHADGVITTYAHLTSTPYAYDINGNPRISNETRSKNVALLYCMKQ